MTTQSSAEPRLAEADAGQVVEFLQQHPDFLDQHPELLAELRLSHGSGSAVSLIERQVQVLRARNEELRDKLRELVEVARDNDRLNERMHRLTLGLLRTSTLAELTSRLRQHLLDDFQADAVALRLPGPDEQQQGGDTTMSALFPFAFEESQPQCGRLRQEQLEFLFAEQADSIESAAVVPLGEKAQQGLLAIGSRELSRFNPCMGTLFLSNLGELLAALLPQRAAG